MTLCLKYIFKKKLIFMLQIWMLLCVHRCTWCQKNSCLSYDLLSSVYLIGRLKGVIIVSTFAVCSVCWHDNGISVGIWHGSYPTLTGYWPDARRSWILRLPTATGICSWSRSHCWWWFAQRHRRHSAADYDYHWPESRWSSG